LDQLIEHDEKLITSAEGILQQSMAIKGASSPDELRSGLQQLLDSIDGYGELLERRNEIIKEL